MTLARTRAYRNLLVLGAPLLLFFAAALESSALYVLALGFGLVLALGWRLARVQGAQVTARRAVYPSAFEDETVTVEVVVENHARGATHLVEVVDAFGPAVADRQALLEPGPLGGRRRRQLRYRTACTRPWGSYAVGPLTLTTSDPLGLFRTVRVQGAVEPFTVFPRVHDVPALERLGGARSLTSQEVTAGRAGQSALFLGVREYRPGDELRRMHWPASARRGSPVVKEFEADLVPYVSVFLDLERSHRAGTGKKSTLEYVVRTACSLVWSSSGRGHMVQAFGEGAEPLFVPPGHGEGHLARALFELIRVRQEGEVPLPALVDAHRPHLPESSIAILLYATAHPDPADLALMLDALASRAVRPVMVLVDADSFVPLDRWPLPLTQALARKREALDFLAERAVPTVVLGAEHDLAVELKRPDLFDPLRASGLAAGA